MGDISKNDMDGVGAEEKPELEAFLSNGRKPRKNALLGWLKHGRSVDSDDEWVHSLDLVVPEELKRSAGRAQVYFCSEFKDFTWRRHKRQVLCVCCSFTILLLVVLILELLQSSRNLVMTAPWMLCIALSILLLCFLSLDYNNSRVACNTISPLVVLVAWLSWYMPEYICEVKVGAVNTRECKLLQHEGFEPHSIFLVSALPLLLSSAPIMAWHVSCALTGAIVSLFLSAAIYRMGMRDPPSSTCIRYTFSFVPIIFLSSALLSYHGYQSEKELFSLLSSWKEALSHVRLDKEEAQKELENSRFDSSDKIAKMRQFISYIFHEIRVPFNGVVLGIGHLLATNVSEEQQEVLHMMDASASSMIRILNDVLDMGKIESGKLQLEKQPFNLGELVSSLIWAFKDTLESKGLEFCLCVDDSTKEFLSGHDLLGDKHRIQQVLANYLSNATKFTPRGGKVKLHLVWSRNGAADCGSVPGEAQVSGDLITEGSNTYSQLNHEISELARKQCSNIAMITVSVEDTGIGISKEDQARLFEPYMQIHAGSTQAHGGTGLGLSFSKRIVELAGGKIGVFSDVGKGSVFSFTIPFEIAPSAEGKTPVEVFVNPFDLPAENHIEASLNSSSGLPNARLVGPNPRVLIVEDNQMNRKILTKLLESFNIKSDAVEDGQQAVELCRSGVMYDMILIDKEMPVMDGHEATREIRAMGIRTTIVGLTGNALDSDRNQFLAAGVNDFFTKPLSRHQLLRLLETHGLVTTTSS